MSNPSLVSSTIPIPPRCTSVPNVLLDDWMPRLTDTELRLLLIVTRQTLGFQATGKMERGKPASRQQRRACDWATHSQLKAKTGRASAAVSHAIDELITKGLLEVCTQDGTPLLTPQERRRWRSKMFFSLAPHLLTEP